jgi:hypothetical protein
MVVDLLHPHVLPRKDLAQIDLLALVADAAAVRDGAGSLVERVGERRQAGVRAWRADVDVGGHAHGQGLVRPPD